MEAHKKLYEESIVKDIMISTALCVQELMQEDKNMSEEEVCLFLEENYFDIIEDTLSSDSEED